MNSDKRPTNRIEKRLTNIGFTKRIDHETIHHYESGIKEPAVCEACGAIYVDRRWSNVEADPQNLNHQRWGTPQIVTCPACKQEQKGEPNGFVHINGEFAKSHKDDIEHLLKNEAERAGRDNPLARIMGWEKGDGSEIIVTTTTEHLAQRLGHALEKAYKGTVDYKFAYEDKVAHVWWRRD